MKITSSALRKLIREAIDGNRIIQERPWSVEYTFSLSGGTSSDSEGEGPDGFAIVMTTESGAVGRVVVDTYWNPQIGDQSGNSLKFEFGGEEVDGGVTYVPVRFDDGKKHKLVLSNAPVPGMLAISHMAPGTEVPVVYLVVPTPFGEDDDVEFSTESLGNGEVDVELTGHVNL